MTQHKASNPWLFSRRLDLSVYTAPALIALLLLVVFPDWTTTPHTPPWLWVVGILLVDVAHVWSTLFVTYFDRRQLRQHPWRYVLAPTGSWLLGWLAYRQGGATLFWTGLAYLAVLHFVRQQAGWLALYRARFGEGSDGRLVDLAAIYAATLYPLLWWHTRLPRQYVWFLPGDFQQGLPEVFATAAFPLYLACLSLYAARATYNAWRGQPLPWGKHLLVSTTALTWYVGIIATNSDVAFTLMNVFTHGLPYGLLVFSYGRRNTSQRVGLGPRLLSGPWYIAALKFAGCLWLLSVLEELSWDSLIWQEGLLALSFGVQGPTTSLWGATSLEPYLVPLLAVPQLTHYLLDGIIWKSRNAPELKSWLASLP